jgi:DNA-binding transcriptional LysR family regulator
MDRLTALNVFRHVVEIGSFAGAARHLGLSPAAVSKNIGELEATLGARLLNRTTRRMSLTEAGTVYYGRVTRFLDDLEEADRTISTMQDNPSGHLRITAPVTLTLLSFSQALPAFLERYPDISIDLHMDDRRVNLVEGGYDLAIRGSGRLEDSSLVARKLAHTPLVVCGAPAYFERHGKPVSPENLARHSCIQFALSDHADEWLFQKKDRVIRVPVNGRYKVSSSLAVRDALRAGFGVSLIPWLYVKDDVAKARLCTVLDDWSSAEMSTYAIYPSRRQLPAKVRVFLEFLTEVFARGEQ